MLLLVPESEDVGGSMNQCVVGRRLREVALVTVRVTKGIGGVDEEAIGRISNGLAVLLMAFPHINVNVAHPRMVCCVEIGDFGQQRTRISCQRVEEKTVDA